MRPEGTAGGKEMVVELRLLAPQLQDGIIGEVVQMSFQRLTVRKAFATALRTVINNVPSVGKVPSRPA